MEKEAKSLKAGEEPPSGNGRGVVEISHLFAKNAKEWGTRREMRELAKVGSWVFVWRATGLLARKRRLPHRRWLFFLFLHRPLGVGQDLVGYQLRDDVVVVHFHAVAAFALGHGG